MKTKNLFSLFFFLLLGISTAAKAENNSFQDLTILPVSGKTLSMLQLELDRNSYPYDQVPFNENIPELLSMILGASSTDLIYLDTSFSEEMLKSIFDFLSSDYPYGYMQKDETNSDYNVCIFSKYSLKNPEDVLQKKQEFNSAEEENAKCCYQMKFVIKNVKTQIEGTYDLASNHSIKPSYQQLIYTLDQNPGYFHYQLGLQYLLCDGHWEADAKVNNDGSGTAHGEVGSRDKDSGISISVTGDVKVDRDGKTSESVGVKAEGTF